MYALIILSIFVVSLIYAHLRGKEKLKLSRQLFDHSTFLAPINMLMTSASKYPNQAFYDIRQFPELFPLEQHWQDIRAEALALDLHIKAAQNHNDAGFNTFFKRGWKRFYLKWYQNSHPSAQQLCPRTVALLEQIPQVKAAMFASLPAGSHLGKHRDPYAGSLRYHLGLDTPNDDACYIEVDQQRYSWRDGQATLFDETYVHAAYNHTEHNRIILFCDIERPMKWRWAEKTNQFFAKYVMAAASSPNDEQDRTGGINKVFKYGYLIHQYGRKIKASHPRRYYVYKWLMYLIIIAVILSPSLI